MTRFARLRLDTLEDRVVPATVSIIREATGATAAAIQATVDTFRADLGANNGAGAATTGGRREINWDGVPDTLASPSAIPADQFLGRGALLTTPGAGVAVSQDDDAPADLDPDLVRFSDVNPTYATAFATFSAERLFAAQGSNVVDVTFTIPGTTQGAVTRGFGVVFTDVDAVGDTRVDFFDDHGTLVLSRQVLGTPGDGTFSFLGVAFAGNCIARVRIVSGSAAILTGVLDVTQGGAADLAVMDDFIFAEPQLHALTPLAVSGQPNGGGAVFLPDRATGQYPATPTATLAGFGGGTNVRTAVGDVNGDCIPDVVAVTGPGAPIRVAVVSGADNTTVLVEPFDPFGGNFTGGGFVTAGDLDGDGNVEFAVTPDEGGGPRVTIFSRDPFDGTLTTRANFFGIDDPNFRGGARAALGDVNGDGVPDLAVGAGFLGGPRVALFDGTTLLATPTRLINDFFAFPGTDAQTLRNGVFVAAGDVTGDGRAELIFGGGPGGAPRVFILGGDLLTAGNVAGAQAAPVANFFVAGNDTDRGGVRVAATDADDDNRADVAAGSGEGRPAGVRVYLGANFSGSGEPATFQDVTVFGGAALPGGVFVGSAALLGGASMS